MTTQANPGLVLLTVNLCLYWLIGFLLCDLMKHSTVINLSLKEAILRLMQPMPLKIELVFYQVLLARFGREILISILTSIAFYITWFLLTFGY